MKLEIALCKALEAEFDRKENKLPPGAVVLWEAFTQLSRQRSVSSNGPNPLSFSEIHAWSQLMRMPIQPHQTRAILAMDQVWIKRYYARQGPPEGVEALPTRSTHEMTPAMFDLAMG